MKKIVVVKEGVNPNEKPMTHRELSACPWFIEYPPMTPKNKL